MRSVCTAALSLRASDLGLWASLSGPGEDLDEQSGVAVQARERTSQCRHDFVGCEQQREPAEHLAFVRRVADSPSV